MKKLFVLLVLVVAMVAAPLFAEVTLGDWGGDFRYKMGGNFSDAAVDETLNDLDLSLNASVGEFTTFSAGFSGAETKTTTGTAGDFALGFSSIEMTQDFSSFIGNDIILKMTVGNFKREVNEYEVLDQMGQTDGAEENGVMATVGVADVTLYAWVSPTSAVNNDDGKFVVEAVYETDAVSGNFGYLNDGTNEMGFIVGGLKVAVADATAAAMLSYDMSAEVAEMSAGVGYTMAPITAEAEFYSTDVSETDLATVQAGVKFAATDAITLAAGTQIPFNSDLDIGFDGGVIAKIDTVEYKLGVSYKGSSYMAPYKSTDVGAEDVAVSLQMDVDF